MKIKMGVGGASLNSAVLTEYVFYNLKAGEHASDTDLEKEFGTRNIMEVSEKIIKKSTHLPHLEETWLYRVFSLQ